MISTITQNISQITALPGLLVETRPAAVNQLVEQELPTFSIEAESLVGQLNTFIDETNQTATEVETNKNIAIQSTIIATSLANYQGAYSSAVNYMKSQSVSVGLLYYISKDDNNLNHIVTDTNYWLANPINTKIDYDMSGYTSKDTPNNADLIPLSDSTAGFGIKKLTWANIKDTIISSFGSMISTLTAKTTPVDADIFPIADSAASNASKKLTWANIKATLDATWVANDTRAKTALNATGTAPIYANRAWVNFNGTGTVAIRASGNVSSITDNGVGAYSVNLTTAMPDANYSISRSAGKPGGGEGATRGIINNSSSFGISILEQGGGSFIDAEYVFASVIR